MRLGYHCAQVAGCSREMQMTAFKEKSWVPALGLVVVAALVLAVWQPAPLVNGIAVAKFAHESSAKCGTDEGCVEQLGKTFGAVPGTTSR